MHLLNLAAFYCLVLKVFISGTTEVRNTNYDLFSRLNQANYDDIPVDTDEPTVVDIDLYINGLSDISSISMEYRVDVFLTQRWNDSRLMFNQSAERFISLPDNLIPKLWIPDLFISQAKDGKVHSITALSKVVKLRPSDGTLLCSQRIQAEIACAMDLIDFPFDTQHCEIKLESWRYDMDFVKLRWLPGSFDGDYDNNKVDDKLSKALSSLSVDTSAVENEICNDSARPNFSCLNYYITFRRKLSYYVGDIYIPSLLMVIVTWMSFWIDRKVIQGRCALGALTMVAISNQINSVKLVLPATAQVKAADIWLWTCEFYVLAAFLQFGLVNYLSRSDAKKNGKDNTGAHGSKQTDSNVNVSSTSSAAAVEGSNNNNGQVAEEVSDEGVAIEMRPLPAQPDSTKQHAAAEVADADEVCQTRFSRWWKGWSSLDNAAKVDNFSRVFFPGSFALFTLVYWAYFMRVSG